MPIYTVKIAVVLGVEEPTAEKACEAALKAVTINAYPYLSGMHVLDVHKNDKP